jgi:hypothetical protein
MSYCVNCGVELHQTSRACPLCNVPVINPIAAIDTASPTPYPPEKGLVTPIKHTDVAILLSVVYITTALVCGLLNFFVFPVTMWSLYIIGLCIVLWIFSVPAILYTKLSIYLNLVLDGLAVALYIGLIAYRQLENDWYFQIALPIIITIGAIVLLFIFLSRRMFSSILKRAVLLFIGIGILCVEIEMLLCHYFNNRVYLSWSAIVLTCCVIIVVTLITIIRRADLRETVRRRMHL